MSEVDPAGSVVEGRGDAAGATDSVDEILARMATASGQGRDRAGIEVSISRSGLISDIRFAPHFAQADPATMNGAVRSAVALARADLDRRLRELSEELTRTPGWQVDLHA